mmetsp:Transcript_4912/g.11452  ORF Transcript_4912/g.11452 Transcript_4912/m.11452 type:complete len:200 (-) Transcript_4912:1093-1692(-)
MVLAPRARLGGALEGPVVAAVAVIVLSKHKDLVLALNLEVMGGVDDNLSVPRLDSNWHRVVEPAGDLIKGQPLELRPVLYVKLVAIKPHQILQHVREARLPGALDHEAPDDVVGDDHLTHVGSDELHKLLVVDIAQLNDHRRLHLAVRVAPRDALEGEHLPHHPAVRVVGSLPVGGETYDRPRRVHRHLEHLVLDEGVA